MKVYSIEITTKNREMTVLANSKKEAERRAKNKLKRDCSSWKIVKNGIKII